MTLEGFIDWKQLRELVTSEPVIKRTQFESGDEMARIYITIGERKSVSKQGYTHFVKVNVNKDLRKENVNYFVGNVKPAEQRMTAVEQDINEVEGDLPF